MKGSREAHHRLMEARKELKDAPTLESASKAAGAKAMRNAAEQARKKVAAERERKRIDAQTAKKKKAMGLTT